MIKRHIFNSKCNCRRKENPQWFFCANWKFCHSSYCPASLGYSYPCDSYPCDGIFNQRLTTIKDSYSLLCVTSLTYLKTSISVGQPNVSETIIILLFKMSHSFFFLIFQLGLKISFSNVKVIKFSTRLGKQCWPRSDCSFLKKKGDCTWQNQQNDMCAQRKLRSAWASPSQIRIFAVRMKKPWVLSYPLSAPRRLIRLGGCPGWFESLLGAQLFCCFVVLRLINLIRTYSVCHSVCILLDTLWQKHSVHILG